MDEVAVDHAQVVAAIHGVEELLAHAHQRRRAAGREIEPAQKLLPARLGGGVNLRRGGVGRGAFPRGDCGFKPRMVGSEAGRQCLEEGDAWARGGVRLEREDLARERDPRGLAAAGQELVAQLDQAGRTLLRALASLARAGNQRATAISDGRKQFAKKRRVHGENLAPCDDSK